MLNSAMAADLNKASVRRSAFLQTCSLLSQFVKEKKTLGDLTFGIPCNTDGQDPENALGRSTMNLFPLKEMVDEAPNAGNGNSMSLFPQHSCFTAPEPASSEPQYAPMTIFYGGQVMVFNDFPAQKAKQIMEFANNGISLNLSASTATADNNHRQMPEPAQQCGVTILNDLPITRKASLHRFLEKRKDRIIARAPYEKSKQGNVSSDSKAYESSAWLGFGAADAARTSIQP